MSNKEELLEYYLESQSILTNGSQNLIFNLLKRNSQFYILVQNGSTYRVILFDKGTKRNCEEKINTYKNHIEDWVEEAQQLQFSRIFHFSPHRFTHQKRKKRCWEQISYLEELSEQLFY